MMQGIINVHCHLLNFESVPDSFLRTRAPVNEWLIRNKFTGWLARGLTFVLPGNKHDRLHEMMAIMRKDINTVAETYISEMNEAEIVLATPLMMDIAIASFNVKPEIPYRYQVEKVSDIASEYPGVIMPFVMFDPRRRSVSELIKTSLGEMGFLGVKMYPPLGYHPDPCSFLNAADVNYTLQEIYEYCEDNSIPITTHCSKGGAYSGDLMHCKELVLDFCHPSSWKGVLKRYPKLDINFAHFGGNGDFLNMDNPEYDSWSNVIQELINEYDNVYADTAYHDGALIEKTSRDYFDILIRLMNDNKMKERIIFGTDWLMTRHTWKEEEYVEAFTRELPAAMLERIAFRNPLNFLFPGGKLPSRIKNFFEKKGIDEADLPQWMKSNLKI